MYIYLHSRLCLYVYLYPHTYVYLYPHTSYNTSACLVHELPLAWMPWLATDPLPAVLGRSLRVSVYTYALKSLCTTCMGALSACLCTHMHVYTYAKVQRDLSVHLSIDICREYREIEVCMYLCIDWCMQRLSADLLPAGLARSLPLPPLLISVYRYGYRHRWIWIWIWIYI